MNIIPKPAKELEPGDVVVGPFATKTVRYVDVEERSIADDGGWHDVPSRPQGVTVRYTDGTGSGLRIDAVVDVQVPS